MDAKYEFYKYNPNLDVQSVYDEGKERLFEELKMTRNLYEALDSIFEDSLDGFFITDGHGIIIRVNRSYEEMSGVKKEEIIGKSVAELEGVTISKSASLEVMRTKKPFTIEQEYLRTKRFAYITSTPIFDKNGKMAMIVSNNRDFKEIDKLKNYLEATRELANQYELKIKAIADQALKGNPIIVKDKKMYEVLYKANKVAKTSTTVLILGETGTGKEEIAKFVHQNSYRDSKSFMRINCGAISKHLMESELFGYEKGAFTGASSTGKLGYFEVADEGTLFLDEIGELSLELQIKLLRVLNEGEIVRVGGNKSIKIDVRIIAATNRDLRDMVNKKLFREDLYYRLNVVQITIPPLRERKDDIVPLTDFFLNKYNEKYHCNKTLSQYSYSILSNYKWAGNVRELKNNIEQMVIMSENDTISSTDLIFSQPLFMEGCGENENIDLNRILEQTEYEYIKKYSYELGTLKLVAEKLGMNVKTLSRRKCYFEEKYGK